MIEGISKEEHITHVRNANHNTRGPKMTEQTIDVTGLPEGWKAVAIRKCCIGDYWFNFDTKEVYQSHSFIGLALIVQKIQPREITLVETDEFRIPRQG